MLLITKVSDIPYTPACAVLSRTAQRQEPWPRRMQAAPQLLLAVGPCVSPSSLTTGPHAPLSHLAPGPLVGRVTPTAPGGAALRGGPPHQVTSHAPYSPLQGAFGNSHSDRSPGASARGHRGRSFPRPPKPFALWPTHAHGRALCTPRLGPVRNGLCASRDGQRGHERDRVCDFPWVP